MKSFVVAAVMVVLAAGCTEKKEVVAKPVAHVNAVQAAPVEAEPAAGPKEVWGEANSARPDAASGGAPTAQ